MSIQVGISEKAYKSQNVFQIQLISHIFFFCLYVKSITLLQQGLDWLFLIDSWQIHNGYFSSLVACQPMV